MIPSGTDFLALLHDAVLHQVSADWEARCCLLQLGVFNQPGGEARLFQLHFPELRRLSLAAEHPWGQSLFVNSASALPGKYVLEMQSGDLIEIVSGPPEVSECQ